MRSHRATDSRVSGAQAAECAGKCRNLTVGRVDMPGLYQSRHPTYPHPSYQVVFANIFGAMLDLAAICRCLHFCPRIALQRVLAAGSVPPQCVGRTTIPNGSAAVTRATTKLSKSQGTQTGASEITFLHNARHRAELASGTSARSIVTVHGRNMRSGDAPGGGRV